MKTSSFSLPSNHFLSPPSSTVTLAVSITDVLTSIVRLSNTSVLWWLSIVAAVMSFTYSTIGLGLGVAQVIGLIYYSVDCHIFRQKQWLICSSVTFKLRIAETEDIQIKRWATGKESNMRALLSTLQYLDLHSYHKESMHTERDVILNCILSQGINAY
ncbi:amino acid permease 3-like isoform X2 [Senna tora]|uniref:Amino acid permease 3-like isoform X2 n=1 Tax=Senna tora TaxID=362788 RepID=A0A834T1W8_9FABA|nr:amino acid permease 3-like isoform X2 [Senna tora]